MILFFIGGEDMARKAYSEEDRVQVRNALMTTMIQCIADRGLIHSSIDPRLFGNLALSMMMVHKAIPDTMPFLFPEVAEDMVDFQVRALMDEMERVKEHVR